jgi:UDP-3-O-[3-hydroxymyristoyl] glucosamine N-acyltransferase
MGAKIGMSVALGAGEVVGRSVALGRSVQVSGGAAQNDQKSLERGPE